MHQLSTDGKLINAARNGQTCRQIWHGATRCCDKASQCVSLSQYCSMTPYNAPQLSHTSLRTISPHQIGYIAWQYGSLYVLPTQDSTNSLPFFINLPRTHLAINDRPRAHQRQNRLDPCENKASSQLFIHYQDHLGRSYTYILRTEHLVS